MFLVAVLSYTVVAVARNITAGSKIFCFILGHETKYNSKRNIHDKNVIFSHGSGAFQPCSQLATMQNYIIENCKVYFSMFRLSIASPFSLYFSLSSSTNYYPMSFPHPLRLIHPLTIQLHLQDYVRVMFGLATNCNQFKCCMETPV